MSYEIGRTPSPLGTRTISPKILVTDVSGVDEVYMQDDELRARFDNSDGKTRYFVVTYNRLFDDDTTREFTTRERITAEKDSFSLSKLPDSTKLVSTTITVEEVNLTE